MGLFGKKKKKKSLGGKAADYAVGKAKDAVMDKAKDAAKDVAKEKASGCLGWIWDMFF